MYFENDKLIFNKDLCDNCYQEALAWDDENYHQKILEIYGINHYKNPDNWTYNIKNFTKHPNNRLLKDPKKQKNKEFRRCDKWRGNNFNWSKEPTVVRKNLNKSFRKKVKQKLSLLEVKIRSRDYKTYGWHTW